jgi:hypothetical protein
MENTHGVNYQFPIMGMVFWIAIVLIVAVGALRLYLIERERQQTLRAALEHGQQIDPALLKSIIAKQQRSTTPQHLQIGGTIVVGLGLGLAALGGFLSLGSASDRNALIPLLGAGSLLVCLGGGIFFASRFVNRSNDGPSPPDAGV